MTKFGGYSIGIAQSDDEIKEKLIFRTLLSAHWSAGLTCLKCAVFLLVACKISMMPF